MTDNAKNFITPLTLGSLSHNMVMGEHNRFVGDGHTHHIEMAEWADLMVIAPATYNTIRKICGGVTDNFLLNVLVPFRGMKKPLIICPAMNTHMWNDLKPFMRTGSLTSLDTTIYVNPIEGRLACGTVGVGKLAKTRTIVEILEETLRYKNEVQI